MKTKSLVFFAIWVYYIDYFIAKPRVRLVKLISVKAFGDLVNCYTSVIQKIKIKANTLQYSSRIKENVDNFLAQVLNENENEIVELIV